MTTRIIVDGKKTDGVLLEDHYELKKGSTHKDIPCSDAELAFVGQRRPPIRADRNGRNDPDSMGLDLGRSKKTKLAYAKCGFELIDDPGHKLHGKVQLLDQPEDFLASLEDSSAAAERKSLPPSLNYANDVLRRYGATVSVWRFIVREGTWVWAEAVPWDDGKVNRASFPVFAEYWTSQEFDWASPHYMRLGFLLEYPEQGDPIAEVVSLRRDHTIEERLLWQREFPPQPVAVSKNATKKNGATVDASAWWRRCRRTFNEDATGPTNEARWLQVARKVRLRLEAIRKGSDPAATCDYISRRMQGYWMARLAESDFDKKLASTLRRRVEGEEKKAERQARGD